MGKEASGSDHEVYDMESKDLTAPVPKKEEDLTPEELEKFHQLRKAVAESGAQIGKRRWEAAKSAEDQQSTSDESDTLTWYEPSDNRSAAYAELGRRGPASASMVNAADKLTHDSEEARILAASELAREKRDARVSAQRAVNAEGMAQVREALDLPSAESDPLEGLSKSARDNIAESTRKNAARQKEQDKIKPANTVEAARERLQEIKDDRE